MVNAIRNYFLKYNFPKKALMNVDSLPSKSNNFSIDFTPCKPIVEQYINGTCLKQQTFVLAGRFAYSNDNSHILAFFEDLSNWINNNNNKGVYPILGGNKTSEIVEVLSKGYLINQEGTEARYQIQLRLVYREEEV